MTLMLDDLELAVGECLLAANDDLFTEYKRLGYKEITSPSGYKRWTRSEYLGEVNKKRAMRVFVPDEFATPGESPYYNPDKRVYVILGYEPVLEKF